MICNVRLDISDDMRARFKQMHGVHPTRKAIKTHVTKMFTAELYPDGPPKPKKTKFKLTR